MCCASRDAVREQFRIWLKMVRPRGRFCFDAKGVVCWENRGQMTGVPQAEIPLLLKA